MISFFTRYRRPRIWGEAPWRKDTGVLWKGLRGSLHSISERPWGILTVLTQWSREKHTLLPGLSVSKARVSVWLFRRPQLLQTQAARTRHVEGCCFSALAVVSLRSTVKQLQGQSCPCWRVWPYPWHCHRHTVCTRPQKRTRSLNSGSSTVWDTIWVFGRAKVTTHLKARNAFQRAMSLQLIKDMAVSFSIRTSSILFKKLGIAFLNRHDYFIVWKKHYFDRWLYSL